VGGPQRPVPHPPKAGTNEDADIDSAFTKYGHSDREESPPSSPDSEGG